MSLYGLVILAASLSIAGELQKLDGPWVVESVLRDPREKRLDEGKGIRCVVENGRAIVQLPGEEKVAGVFVIKIDPAMKPKTMEIRPEGENGVILAIYELRGDSLRVCWTPQGKERPTDFASNPGSGDSLIVLKRKISSGDRPPRTKRRRRS